MPGLYFLGLMAFGSQMEQEGPIRITHRGALGSLIRRRCARWSLRYGKTMGVIMVALMPLRHLNTNNSELNTSSPTLTLARGGSASTNRKGMFSQNDTLATTFRSDPAHDPLRATAENGKMDGGWGCPDDERHQLKYGHLYAKIGHGRPSISFSKETETCRRQITVLWSSPNQVTVHWSLPNECRDQPNNKECRAGDGPAAAAICG